MYGFIYITTNRINGKRYIGQRKYYKGWKTYLGSGTALKEAIEKYGEENFERKIIAEANSKEELNELEIKFIKEYDAVNSRNFYNISTGGDVIIMPPEKQLQANKKLSEKYSGENAIWYGKHHLEESKSKISKTRKKRFKEGMKNSMSDKKHSDETKQKMSDSMRGIHKTEEAKKNIGQSVRDRSPIMYAVRNNIAYEFNSVIDLAEWLINNGESHTDKIANVKKAIFTRLKNGKDYYGYIFFKENIKVNVETIERVA